jgi:hypothetical protein
MRLLALIFSHYLGDFGLQSDWMAKNKVDGEFWAHVMVAHCSIQALGVLLITKNPILAGAEFVAHFAIDHSKCRGWLTFTQDQLLHIVCRCIWWVLA